MGRNRTFKEICAANKGKVIASVTAVGVLLGSGIGCLVSYKRNAALGVEGPSADRLNGIENAGQLTGETQKPEGTVGNEYGKDDALNNFNTIIAGTPAKNDDVALNNLLNGTLTFQTFDQNSSIITKYAFNQSNNTYTTLITTQIDVAGRIYETQSETSGYYTIENGAINLFEGAGLNPGEQEDSYKYTDIIFIGADGNVYSTINGEAVTGVSDVYTPTPTI